MSLLKKIFLPLFIIILTFIFLNVFRIVPVSKLFNGYAVMFVQKEIPAKNVENLLLENKAKNIVYFENQKVPLNLPEQSPEVALSKTGLEKSNYLSDRNGFFSDKSKSLNIFYVPNEFIKSAEKVVQNLSENGIFCGINASAKFPIISVLIVILFSLFLIFISKKKILISLLYILPLFFSVMMPFSSISASLCLFNLTIFLCLKFYKREGGAKKISKNVMILTFLGTSFIVVLFTKIQAGLLFILLCLAEISICFLYKNISDILDNRYSFKPVNIIGAKSIKVLNEKNKKLLILCSSAILLIFIYSIFSFSFAPAQSNKKSVQLPSAYSATSSLPNLNDFEHWKWEALTFPYISINSKNKTQNSVIFKNYEEKNGLISESLSYISYNNEFQANSIKEIENLDYPAIEKVLVMQEKNAKFGYVSSGTQNLSLIMIFLLVFSFAVPFVFYLGAKRLK